MQSCKLPSQSLWFDAVEGEEGEVDGEEEVEQALENLWPSNETV